MSPSFSTPAEVAAQAQPPKRKSKGKSPTARCLEDLRKLGYVAEKVEQRLPNTFITRDYINVGDILAFRPGSGILLVQVTSGSNHAARRKKAMDEPLLRQWLEAGGRFEVWSYDLQGAKNQRKLWTQRREELSLKDFA
jgi:hypothetical protein